MVKELSWKEISERLKVLRKQNKLTIERLAELVGVSTSFIGLIEKGDSGVSLENLYKLSQIFNCSIDYLVTGKEIGSPADTHAGFKELNAALYDYQDKEIDFIIDLSKFLRNRVAVK